MIPVCVVAYRNWEALHRCRDSVETSTMPAEFWVHDNSLRNIGLTKGINKLLSVALIQEQRYVLWANHDIQLDPDAIACAVTFMDSHPNCAVAGFKLLDSSDPDRITHGGTGDCWPVGQHLQGRVSSGHLATSRKMTWVNMAACILRVDALHEVGLFDENFFLYGQDSQWCYRAIDKGWEVWYCAEAVAKHDTNGCAMHPNPEQQKIVSSDMAYWEHWLLNSGIHERLLQRLDAESEPAGNCVTLPGDVEPSGAAALAGSAALESQ